jgi:dTMP kinase
MKERDKNHERSYLSKKDVHESDHKHLENARKSAIKLVSELNNFIKIDCVSKNQMRTREDIHEEIYEKVKKILKK